MVHNQRADVLVIAASDGDYCHLALHMVERGVRVYGIGEAKAPDKLRKACTKFDEVRTDPLQGVPPPKDSELDRKIVALILSEGQQGAMRVNSLGPRLHHLYGIKISEQPERNWRSYLLARSHLYKCDPKGPDTMVRLVSP